MYVVCSGPVVQAPDSHLRFRCCTVAVQSLGNFTPHCLYLSEETLKATGPFYLVSVPREVKYLGKCITCHALTELVISISQLSNI